MSVTEERLSILFFFQAEDGIEDYKVTGVQTCALPIYDRQPRGASRQLLQPALRHAPADPGTDRRPAEDRQRSANVGWPATSVHRGPEVSPLLAKFLHVRRTELGRTLQVAGFAIVLGWALYTAFSAAQSIFLNKAGPHAYPLFFIVLALSVWPMVALQGALMSRFGVGGAFRITLAANAVVAIGVFAAYRSAKTRLSRSPRTSSTRLRSRWSCSASGASSASTSTCWRAS